MHPASNQRKRIFAATLALTAWFALVLQLRLMLINASTHQLSTAEAIINFFSYFTILSNILVAIVATLTVMNKRNLVPAFSFQSAVAVYITIVALVYNFVLRSVWSPAGLQLLADNLLHPVVPLVYVAGWIWFTPRKVLTWTNVWSWLLFPAAYFVYSVVRGSFVHWFPYPFLDMDKLGLPGVLLNSLMVTAAFLSVGFLIIAFNRSKLASGIKKFG